MEDLLQSQIRESCKLALPNGLQDLMADISREVLRAQPQNIYQFIADYLSALRVAREKMFVAARVCDDICNAECWPELEDELRSIGFSDEDVETAAKVIMEFIQGDQVEERNLLLRLVKKTNIEEHQFPAVQQAVRRAYLAHKRNTEGSYHSSSGGSELDETTHAARHTVNLYRKTIRPDEDYTRAAEKIQAAYRAYRLRRNKREEAPDNSEKSIRFKTKAEQVILGPDFPRLDRCSSMATSLSLAGSFVTLPPFTPYGNTYSDIVELEDVDFDENEEIEKPRKPSVHDESENSPKDEVAHEQIFEKVINDENLLEEVHEEIIPEDKNVFHDTINESTKHDVSNEDFYEDEEITEKVLSMNDDEISDGGEGEFIIESVQVSSMNDDEISDGGEAEFIMESEKVLTMNDDEISDGGGEEFIIESENENDDDEDGKSYDLYSNKEFDYESSKEAYSV